MEAPSRPTLAAAAFRIWVCLATGLWVLHSGVSATDGQLLRRVGAQPPVAAKRAAPRFTASTTHFEVDAPDPVLARKIGQEAERYRKELAIQWLGNELGEWEDKCPIKVELSMHSGGETSFVFVMDRGQQGSPRSWEMNIFGTPERLLDSVLPHEITHTIFASHFGRPLPRWADEGACTIVEHESERAKNHQMLIDFLHTNRGIPFNRMFEMKQYPQDILPLYAQGHSLSKFLVFQKGRRHFLDYIGAGMQAEEHGPLLASWNKTTEKYYGYRDLSSLQEAWIAWVRAGSQETELAAAPTANTAGQQTYAVAPAAERGRAELANSVVEPSARQASFEREASSQPPVQLASGSWYKRQAQSKRESSQKLPIQHKESDPIQASGKLTFQPIEMLTRESNDSGEQTDSSPTIWR